jgi:hypothetical protein
LLYFALLCFALLGFTLLCFALSTHPGHPGSDAEAAADLSSKTHIPAILGMMLKRPQIYQAKQAVMIMIMIILLMM